MRIVATCISVQEGVGVRLATSALGQKRTYAPQKRMSALLPIATAKADISPGSCPLYPRKADVAAHEVIILVIPQVGAAP